MPKTVKSDKSKTTAGITESKDKIKSSEGSGMETGQVEQLDVCLNQSAKVLIKNCDTEETNMSTTSKQDNRSPSPFDSKDTQAEIVMAKKENNSITFGQQLENTGGSKSIVNHRK